MEDIRTTTGIKLVTTKEIIDKIHHTFYSEKIINYKGQNNNIFITDVMEKVKVDDFIFIINKNDTCVSDCLRSGILFEKFLLSFVKMFIDSTKNILDIGANIGCHSIVYSNYTNGNVYAFEPQPIVFELLQKNIESNNCKNIIAYNFGASNSDTIFFMNAHYDHPDNQGAFRICEKGDIGINIICKKLDDLNLSNIGYIKIDVEGHELNTLLGLQKTIQTNLPNLMIEIHETSPTKYDVFTFLENIGYKYYYKLSHCDYIFSFTLYEINL